MKNTCPLFLSLSLAFFSTGCDFLTPQPPSVKVTAEQDVIAEVDKLEAANYPLEETLAYALRLRNWAAQPMTNFQERNRWPDGWSAIDRMFEGARKVHTEPEAQMQLYSREAYIYSAKHIPGSAELLAKALDAKPDVDLYWQLYASQQTDYEGLHGPVCVAVRPLILDDVEFEYEDFLKECVYRVNKDFTLLWDGAEAEYASIEADRQRLRDFYVELATFFPSGGKCNYDDCGGYGWASHSGGTVQVKCIGEGQCAFVGWEANTPTGMVNTRCNGSCLTDGWKSKTESEGTWTATCTDGNCDKNGWVMNNKKQRYTVTPIEGGNGCWAKGFDVAAPDGTKYTCYGHGNAWLAGTECKLVK